MNEPRVKLEEAPGTSDQPVMPTGPYRNTSARVFVTDIAEKNGVAHGRRGQMWTEAKWRV